MHTLCIEGTLMTISEGLSEQMLVLLELLGHLSE
jgi:hypothetical protein